MCEVAVRKGDDCGHVGACSRVSQCECNGEVCESLDTQECVCGMELERENATETTATGGQGPGSGRSYFENRVRLAQQ